MLFEDRPGRKMFLAAGGLWCIGFLVASHRNLVDTNAEPQVWHWCTAADMTTRCAFKIEDPSRGPGRVDFTTPDEGFGLEGTPKPKIQRDPSPQKGNLICGTSQY